MLQLLLLQLLPSLLLLPLLMTTNDVVVVRKTLGHASPSARLTTRHSRPRLARLPDSGPKRYAQRQGLHFFLPSNDHYPYPKWPSFRADKLPVPSPPFPTPTDHPAAGHLIAPVINAIHRWLDTSERHVTSFIKRAATCVPSSGVTHQRDLSDALTDPRRPAGRPDGQTAGGFQNNGGRTPALTPDARFEALRCQLLTPDRNVDVVQSRNGITSSHSPTGRRGRKIASDIGHRCYVHVSPEMQDLWSLTNHESE